MLVNDAKNSIDSAEYFSFEEVTVVADFLPFERIEVGKLFLDELCHRTIEFGNSFKVAAGFLWIPRANVRLATSVQGLHVICNDNVKTKYCQSLYDISC